MSTKLLLNANLIFSLAQWLPEKSSSVLLQFQALKVKHFAKSHNVKSKTDAIDARLIAQLGVERILEPWQPAPIIFRELRALTRFYTALKQQRTAISNWKESFGSSHQPLEFLRKSNQSLL